MKKIMMSLMVGAMSLATVQAMAADKLTLQLKWVAQAQFAGYFVAKEKGFYSEALMQEIAEKGTVQGIDAVPEDIRRILNSDGMYMYISFSGGFSITSRRVPMMSRGSRK